MKKSLRSGGGLRLEIAPNYAEMSRRCADVVISALRKQPDLLLCASAGGTPTGAYASLAESHQKKHGLFSKLRVLQIDEWGGLEAGAPMTCAEDLREKLITPLALRPNQFTGFQTDSTNAPAECARIAKWLAANGPIDVCILGLGLNGHIAMNEPAKELFPFTHVATLTKRSQQHGMLRDLARKPKSGFTLGMQDILGSKQVLLLVSGKAKKTVLRRLLQPQVSTDFPASFLWLHANTTVLCDREAAGEDYNQSNH